MTNTESGGKSTTQSTQSTQTAGAEVADIVESWMWRDPGAVIDRLLARSARIERRGEAISLRPNARSPRDAYYTQARRLHVKRLMKGTP